jgi:thiamine biosynthesis lipoprotein
MAFKLRNFSIFSLFSAILLFSCAKRPQPVMLKFSGETQGTYYTITFYSDDSINLQPAIDSLLARFDSSVSVYKPNSIISRMNNNDTSVRADIIFKTVFNRAIKVSQITNGAFDITVGPLVNAWGFGFSNKLNMQQSKVDSLLPLVNFHHVRLDSGKLVKADPRIKIDFNALAQGYAIDVVAGFLDSKGIQSYLVDIGGEVLARRTKPGGDKWQVAIEKPARHAEDERVIQEVISLQDMAISTSGSYRKFYEENGVRYSHTIDPSSGFPVRHSLLSVSVIASDCMTADAFATAFMVMGVEKAMKFLEENRRLKLQAYFIFTDPGGKNQIAYTHGFEKFFSKK